MELAIGEDGATQAGKRSQAEVTEIVERKLATQCSVVCEVEPFEILRQGPEGLARATRALHRIGDFVLGPIVVAIDQRLLVKVLVARRSAEETEDLGAEVFGGLTGDRIDLADRPGNVEELLFE